MRLTLSRALGLVLLACVAVGLARAESPPVVPPPQAPAPAAPAPSALPDPFKLYDRDGDGKLQREEMPPEARQRFDRLDLDKDGVLTREEAARARQANNPAPPRARVPDAIEFRRDVPYAGTDNPRQRLDVLLPRKRRNDRPLPVVIYIHGGAWLAGDKGSGVGALAPLVEGGAMVGVSVGYRLTPEARWPAQLHDCKAAVRWVRAHAAELGIDPDRVAAMGHSAGGHLVAMLGVTGDAPATHGELGPHVKESTSVRCVVNFFGPSDLLTIGDHPSKLKHNEANSPEGKLLGGAVHAVPDRARDASPTHWVTAADSPMLHIHGTKDDVVPYDQSVRLDAALRKAGVETALISIEGGGHGGFRAQELDTRVRRFLDRHLLGVSLPAPESATLTQQPTAPDKK